MPMIPASVSCRRGVALVCLAVVSVSCAGVNRDVQVPGAAPNPVSAAPDERDEVLFTPGGSEPALAETDSALVTTAPVSPPTTTAPTSPTTTAPTTTAPTTTTVAPAVLATPPSAGVPSVVSPVVSGWAAFDLHIMTLLDAGSPAVSATVLRDGEVVHEVALGARTSAGDSVDIGDRYRIASISKVITATTTMRLVERGLIGLDDRVGERLAERAGITAPAAGVEQITVRQLLTHRSGIGQYENLMFRRQVESCGAAAATGLSRNLERPPGTTLRYSNLNFCLLGLLIEEVTARPYEDVVNEELLAPLGIDGMRLAGTFDVGDDDVEHRSDDGRNYMEVLDAAGSWIASPTEVAAIIDSLDLTTPGWKPLGPDSVAEMSAITLDPPVPPSIDPEATTTTTIEPPPPPTRGYGMGLMIFGPDSFGHTGTLESTHAMTARQADGITWAITVSGDHPSSTRDLAGIVADALRYAGIA